MPSGGAHNVKTHTCRDGKTFEVHPVYFREINEETGSRVFVRRTWFCARCGYGVQPDDEGDRF